MAMSGELPDGHRAGPSAKPLILVLVAVAQAMALSGSVDAQAILHRGVLGRIVGSSGFLLTLLLVVGTTLALSGALSRFAELSRREPIPRAWAGVHGAAFVALLGTSLGLFREDHATLPLPLVAGWCASVALSAVSWLRLHASFSALARHLRTALPEYALAVVLGTLAWGSGLASAASWELGAAVTLRSVAAVLSVVEPRVAVDLPARVIGTPVFAVHVAPECSGFEGIGLLVAYLGVLGVALRGQVPLARFIVALPLAAASAWLLNVLRIVALVWIGTHVDERVAMSGFHSKAGWVLFSVVALALLPLLLAGKTRAAPTPSPVAESEPAEQSGAGSWAHEHPALPYLLPLIALLATALLTSAFAAQVDWVYGVRVVAAGGALLWSARLLKGFERTVRVEAVALGVLVYLVWIALEPVPDANAVAAFKAELGSASAFFAAVWVAFRVIGSVVVVPVAEELAFRGFLYRRLVSAEFWAVAPTRFDWVAWLGSSLAFGVLHQRYLAGTVAGLLFAVARLRRGSLTDAVVAHATSNALIAAQVLTCGHWHLFM
jgi:exosortase E/protease (VPEID-CTERM system)